MNWTRRGTRRSAGSAGRRAKHTCPAQSEWRDAEIALYSTLNKPPTYDDAVADDRAKRKFRVGIGWQTLAAKSLKDIIVHILIDDSTSMRANIDHNDSAYYESSELQTRVDTRFDEAVVFACATLHALATCPVARVGVSFLNNSTTYAGQGDELRSIVSKIVTLARSVRPNGETPLMEAIKNVYAKVDHDTRHLLMLFVDGEPTDCGMRDMQTVFAERDVSMRHVSIFMCTDDKVVISKYDSIVRYPTAGHNLVVMPRFPTELKQAKEVHPDIEYNYMVHVMKGLLGSIVPAIDALDKPSGDATILWAEREMVDAMIATSYAVRRV